MRVRINVEFELSPRVKRALKIGVPVAIVLAASVAIAGVPNTFKDGDPLSAQTMNDNFTSLDTRLAKLEALSAKETADGGISVNARYCGVSTPTTLGDLSGLSVTGAGYAKARNQCTQTCGSPSAHLCTAEELARSAQVGITAGSGWYSTATYAWDTVGVSDCSAWTNATSNQLGAYWNGHPNEQFCNTANPVLCCD